MLRLLPLLLALCLSACALQEVPAPELAPLEPPVTQEDVDALRRALALLHHDVATIAERVDQLEPLRERFAEIETRVATQQSPRKRGQRRPDREPSPQHVIQVAQKAAQVEPSARGYWGNSAEQVFIWQPGRVYTLYLTSAAPTLLTLPPGERILVGLLLDKDHYDVITEQAGTEPLTHSVISIRPKIDKGDVAAFIVVESGRKYLFQLIVGATGMRAVTFETPQITQAAQRSPALILPKPEP